MSLADFVIELGPESIATIVQDGASLFFGWILLHEIFKRAGRSFSLCSYRECSAGKRYTGGKKSATAMTIEYTLFAVTLLDLTILPRSLLSLT